MADTNTTRRGMLGAMALAAPIAIVAPALAARPIPPSKFQALRAEYKALNESVERMGWDEDDPRLLTACDRMSEIERAMVKSPAHCRDDAKAKLGFMVDLGLYGVHLDGEDAYDVSRDIARYLA